MKVENRKPLEWFVLVWVTVVGLSLLSLLIYGMIVTPIFGAVILAMGGVISFVFGIAYLMDCSDERKSKDG